MFFFASEKIKSSPKLNHQELLLIIESINFDKVTHYLGSFERLHLNFWPPSPSRTPLLAKMGSSQTGLVRSCVHSILCLSFSDLLTASTPRKLRFSWSPLSALTLHRWRRLAGPSLLQKEFAKCRPGPEKVTRFSIIRRLKSGKFKGLSEAGFRRVGYSN